MLDNDFHTVPGLVPTNAHVFTDLAWSPVLSAGKSLGRALLTVFTFNSEPLFSWLAASSIARSIRRKAATDKRLRLVATILPVFLLLNIGCSYWPVA